MSDKIACLGEEAPWNEKTCANRQTSCEKKLTA